MQTSPPPLVPEVGVLGFVPDRWSAQWQPRHQVLSRLTRYFRVCWLNPAPEWREVARNPGAYGAPPASPGDPVVHSPDRLLPRFYRPAGLGRLTEQARWSGARRRLVAAGARRLVLYLWRPEFERALHSVAADLRVYHIDDEYTFDEVDRPIPAQERRVIEAADEVFIHSPALIEKKGSINPRSHFVPNGVDYEAHSRRAPEPPELAAVPHPRIGYTGWLKEQLDWDLIAALVERHAEWSFVFVGGVKHPELEPRLARLAAAPNVHLLGGRSSEELARYPQHFDACVMPYRVDGYTKFIYPLKLHEFLASGTPVAASAIRTVEAFRDVVSVASGLDGWSTALREALGAGARSPERIANRKAVAAEHDWERIVEGIAHHIAAGLGGGIPAGLEAAGSARGEALTR